MVYIVGTMILLSVWATLLLATPIWCWIDEVPFPKDTARTFIIAFFCCFIWPLIVIMVPVYGLYKLIITAQLGELLRKKPGNSPLQDKEPEVEHYCIKCNPRKGEYR